MFELYAEKNQLTVRKREPLTSGSVNVCPVRIEFSPDWEGLDRTVIFQAGCREKAVALSGGTCEIPSEPLSVPGCYLMAGVCGRQGTAVVLPTVWANLGMIQEGAVAGDPAEYPDNPFPGDPADHRLLTHRDAEEQHPIASISGLKKELDRIPEPVEALTNFELEDILK